MFQQVQVVFIFHQKRYNMEPKGEIVLPRSLPTSAT